MPRAWAVGDPSYRAHARFFFLGESSALEANNSDACGCHNPLEDTGVVTLVALGLRVKTLDLVVSTTMARASLPS
jgi:hypothetical protein